MRFLYPLISLAMITVTTVFFKRIPAQLWGLSSRGVSSSMRAIVVDKPGGPPESMRLAVDFPTPQAATDQVVIQVAYAGLNRADILQRLGRYPMPQGESALMGLEVAGVVRSVGSGPAAGRFRPGDRVMALLGGGGYADYVNATAELVTRVPSGMSLRDAAAVPEAWLTAFQLMRFVADTKPGDRVLIHAGASGVGTAAIQLAGRVFNGVAFATAGSADKCTFAQRLGAERCFNYREAAPDWSAQLLTATGGHGADVILDCVGAAHLAANAKALARDGRWCLYGLLGGADMPQGAATGFLGELLRKRGSIVASLLRDRSIEYKARLVAEFAERALPLFETGQLRPVIDSEFPMQEVAAAHTKMQANENLGKILLAINPQLELETRQDL